MTSFTATDTSLDAFNDAMREESLEGVHPNAGSVFLGTDFNDLLVDLSGPGNTLEGLGGAIH
jgi:hypothetical protein